VDRDVVLLVAIASFCGPLLALVGVVPGSARGPAHAPTGRGLERASWARLVQPIVPAAILLAVLVGWGLQEPSAADEAPGALLAGTAVAVAVVWVRAVARAIRALLTVPAHLPAATLGILRPRVAIDRTFARVVEPQVLDAVLRHESAHARHRDPLRIWVAQLVTDMQWPSPGAALRLATWTHVLEIARDEEAREEGADGADLAAAILTAERLCHGRPAWAPVAPLTGRGELLRERIERLLAPLPGEDAPPRSPRSLWLALAVSGAVALLFGITYGDAFVRALPGMIAS
jgi:hypothetical protein